MSETTVIVDEDIVYAHLPERPLHLDLYRPPTESRQIPIFVFAHGGAWKTGSKGSFQTHAEALAQYGFATADINYRLSGEAIFPAPVTDMKAAIHWLRIHSDEYQLHPDQIAVAGHSAGAHLTALTATTPEKDEWEPETTDAVSSYVAAAVCISGIYDFTVLNGSAEVHGAFLGGTAAEIPEVYRKASPITHFSSRTPPTLLLHGTEDQYLDYDGVVRYRDVLQGENVPVKLFTAEDSGHTFHGDARWFGQTIEEIAEFIHHYVVSA